MRSERRKGIEGNLKFIKQWIRKKVGLSVGPNSYYVLKTRTKNSE